MFAGHYSVSYAMKKREPGLPLWHLFVAAQFMDIVWSVLILAGVEKADVKTVLPGSHIHLTYMPYTHSLTGALVLSALMYAVYLFRPGAKERNHIHAMYMGAAVFSHWVLDLIVHDGDLPLIGNSFKVGFGLYHSAVWSFTLEAVVLAAGLWMYVKSSQGKSFGGKYGMMLFYAFLLLMNANTMWGPVAPNEKIAAVFLLMCYLLFAYIAARLERKRVPIKPVDRVPQGAVNLAKS